MAVKKTYRINLRNYGSPPAVMVSQYDEGYAIAFEILDGPLPVLASSLSGYTFKLKGRQPGNPPFLAYEFEGTLATALNAVVSFEIDTTMTGRAGKGTAELVILDEENDVKFASVNFAVYTEPAAVPDGSIDADVERAQEIADEVAEIVDGATEGAEAWAVGQRGGVDVESTDPTYHNNAKYYSEVAQDIADSIGIDATLSISGKAADAKKTGDEISSLKEDLNDVVPYPESPDSKYGTAGQLLRTKGNGKTEWVDEGLPTDEQTSEAITAWLNDHPEATTTVQDGSLTYEKLVTGTLGFVTPEMFGAVGDGVTDDTTAVQNALNTHLPLKGTTGKIYYVSANLNAYNNVSDANFKFDTKKMMIFTSISDVIISNCYFEMIGRVADPDDRGQYALAFTYCNNIYVTKCHFYHFTSNIICNVSSNIFVDGNYFYDSYQNATLGNGYGVVLQCCKMVSITNNHFKDVQRHSVYISWADAYDEEPEFDGYNHWCENVIVSNNIFELTDYDHGGYNNTSTEQQVKCLASKNVNIENNQFLGTYGAVFFATEGSDNCENITINNNIIKDQVSDYRAIIVELWQGVNSPINKNISICGNIFQNTTQYPCIKLSKVDGLIVSDNVVMESSEYKTGKDYFCMFFHESGGADKTTDCYKNIKISNNQITKRGLLKLYCEQDSYGLGSIDNLEISNNNANYSGNIVMVAVTNTGINNFRILNNVFKGSSGPIFMPLYSTGFEGDNVFVIGNDANGEVRIFGSDFAGKIYYLRNTNSTLSSQGLPTSAVSDAYEYTVVSTGDFKLASTLEVGNNEVAVTYPRPLRQTPMAIMFVLYDSKFVPTYFGAIALKSGSITTTGFTAIVPKLQATQSDFYAKFIAVGKL